STLNDQTPPRTHRPTLVQPLERELSLEVGLHPLDRCLSVLDRDREAGALVRRSQDKGRLQVFRAVYPLRVGVQPCFYFLEILLTEVFGQASSTTHGGRSKPFELTYHSRDSNASEGVPVPDRPAE